MDCPHPLPTTRTRIAICPSCGRRTVFVYMGDQRWPPRLARRKGFSAMSLWNCQHCHTTISEKYP